MGYRRASHFAFVVLVQAAAIAALIFGAARLAAHYHYYASALVLLAFAALIALALVRTAFAADRLYADFVDALAAGTSDRPPGSARHFPALAAALHRASSQLRSERHGQARRVQELEALLDTVGAALLVVRADGQLVLANRAARTLAGAETWSLADVATIGPVAAERLLHLPVGGREIVHLKAEQRMLASVATFRGADGVPHRLIALQGLSSELSAVETRAWQELVRILAHEMMNSLTPIVSMSDSLQSVLRAAPVPDARLIDDVTEAVDVIGRRSAGLMRFVGRYRQVAELPEPQLETVAAKDLVAQLDRLAVAQCAQHGCAYRSSVEPADLLFRADPELLQQALINLVKNAAEAVADAQDPHVELRCCAVDGQVRIEVADNGRGLPKDDPEKIFTPFFTTKPDGSGIGLALARQIAVAHGGELTVRRAAPGAVFTLVLPRRTGAPLQMNGAE